MSFNTFTDPFSDPASSAANLYGQAAPGAASAGLLETLSKANDFALEDVQANREGWMSPRQRARVVRGTIGAFFFLSLILVGGIVVAVLASVGGFSPLLLVSLSLVGTALLFLLPLTSARRQLRDGRVAMMDGVVVHEMKRESDSDGGNTTSYYYVINQQKFSVTGAAYNALVPGLHYRIYYLPHMHKLVSIEPLP